MKLEIGESMVYLVVYIFLVWLKYVCIHKERKAIRLEKKARC